MMAVMTKSPAGDEIVILSRAEYEKLADAREDADDATVARALLSRVEGGTEETLSTEELDAYLKAPTPLAFWRRKRGLTQAALARQAGVAQGYISEIEAKRKQGDVAVLKRVAQALRISLDDLVTD
jgi:DNA-binding XRE family transcriptional regulator